MWSGEGTTVSNASSQSQTSITAEQQSVASALEYEVFLSFRGPDVRKSFADFLYSYLVHSKIRTFRDEEELRKGETIAPSLIQAITESKIYIPILSKSYASSKWCLQELAKMVECCRKGKGRVILPIFYFMDPRDVRHQAGPYEDAFEQHSKKHDPITVQEWRTALQEVGQMKGWHVTEIDGQGAIVDELFSKVELHLRSNYTLVTEELVGIDSHVQEVMRLLNLDSRDEKIVGIQGIGGMGKTTIAKAVYDNICTNFNRCCFLENIRELLLKNDGIESLQNKFISSILRDDVRVKDASEGVNMIRERVCKYKVLVVLDDVDDKFEFDQILGKLGHFSSESRFIITTRDKRVLELLPECKLYEPEEMSHAHSVQLFSRHAFGMHYIPEGYGALCDEFVKVAAKLPLALKVIGSLLFRRDRQFWEEKLMQLKEVPGTIDKVQQRLKISYNELTYEEKQIFLDIACFFIGEDKELPVHMWSDCKFYPESGIRTLVLRSLIKIDEINRFWMHDHLRDLGRAVVTEEDVECPSKRSRIWSSADAMNMLKNGEATDRVEMLRVDPPWGYYGEIKCFEKLSRLRYLDINVGDFSEILPDLRWLRLSYCNYFHSEFNLKNVETEISLTGNMGKLQKLEEIRTGILACASEIHGLGKLRALEALEISKSMSLDHLHGLENLVHLKELILKSCGLKGCLPNLSKMNKLHKLVIVECPLLSEIQGLGELKRFLLHLEVSCCDKLASIDGLESLEALESLTLGSIDPHGPFPDLLRLQNLKQLSISGWRQFPEFIEFGRLKSLQSLEMKDCKSLKRLSLSSLENLEKLDLIDCKSLKRLSLSSLEKLEKLDLGGCVRLVDIPGLDRLGLLQRLDMCDCRSIEELPDISDMKSLYRLDVSECLNLVTVIGIGKLESLRELYMINCRSIKELSDMSGLKNLLKLNLKGCTNLKNVKGLEKLKRLYYVRMEKRLLLKHPMQMVVANKLKVIILRNCYKFKRVPDLSQCASLESIDLTLCEEVKGELNISNFRNLKVVRLQETKISLTGDMGKLQKLEEIRTDWSGGLTRLPNLGNLSNLMELRLFQFSASEIHGLEKLRVLEALEISESMSLDHLHGLENLMHLKELILKNCGLKGRLPNLSKMNKLHKLVIVECQLLSEIQGLGELKRSLLHLEVSCCDELARIDGLESLEALESLTLESIDPHGPFPDLSRLQNLKELCISGWRQFPEFIEFGRLKSLQTLEMKDCKSLKRLSILSSLENLETLDLSGCVRLVDIPGLDRLGSLQKLNMSNCRSIEELPDISDMKSLNVLDVSECFNLVTVIGIEKLESLRELYMVNCRSIKELPDMSGLKNLLKLNLKGCTNLKNVKGLKKLKRLYIVRMEKRLQLKHPLQMVVWAGRELEDSTSLAIMLLLV
ncbi:Disease resistance protein L6 [Linum grandiflorum]